jgi:hypothetical protein
MLLLTGMLEENRIAREVVDAALRLHRHFGPGIYESVHFKQLLTYLRLTGLRLGLLINFGEKLLRDGIHRVVNDP